MRKLLYWLTGFLPCRIIDIDGKPYLERYYIGKLLGRTFYLHRFVSDDSERHLHDHPWLFSIAFVLAGSYIEERSRGLDPVTGWVSVHRKIAWYRPNIIRGTDFHRITKPKPNTWTLFIHSPRAKGWGFVETFLDGFGTPLGVKYIQPYDVTGSKNWHLGASLGRECTRRVPG